MRFVFVASLVAVVASALVACARERVDVGDVDGGGEGAAVIDAQPTIVPGADGGVDVVLVTCGPPPAIGRCAESCPNGYETAPDGEATCACCP